ncbi:uncharacterized protein YdiU (UPF0061 family) [Desulfomicrobium macestii]|uniref:Protein nucleotidyltransferase YdiU n=1 Tax=Desulfomicrobium macestii TaxID=90731 RepID=A0ABR9GYS1_9BACT|nr:YdiU family protein [Desulfomicrobium macestii]MBE1423592.1 uncharacterized protein YdiU (UPF0061 family) [Desulfomicrobium macestii]
MSSQDQNPLAGQGWNFDNTYTRLPESLFVRQKPIAVKKPGLALLNRELASSLGLDADSLDGPEGAAVFAGNSLPAGADPIAQAYAGHQFGHFTMLGDGRAILLGEHVTARGERFDIQLKGSGQTPFSRRGDGRAALGPMLREYVISEAMHALGIPTTRSLAVATTGEPVHRETTLAGAVLTRVASSHIRVGTFEYLAARGKTEDLRILAEYTIRRHYPELAEARNPFLELLRAVMEGQARLVTSWLHVGFIHGVMNTDNMALCGESIDYGPCAFMDAYDPATVFSSIDRDGRYAYGNQPSIAQWNLTRLAETLLPLLHEREEKATVLAQETLEEFPAMFRRHWIEGMRDKLGLFTAEDEDASLTQELLKLMQEGGADYTLTLRGLTEETPDGSFYRDIGFMRWRERWEARLARQHETPEESRILMRAHNPAVIPRNRRVEEALEAATLKNDLEPMKRLLDALSTPFEDRPEHARYRNPAPLDADYRTFCGT